MAQTNKDIFGVLTQEDKQDGLNYSIWSFMVKNVLVTKGFGITYLEMNHDPELSPLLHQNMEKGEVMLR